MVFHQTDYMVNRCWRASRLTPRTHGLDGLDSIQLPFQTDELASGHVALMPGETKIGNPTVQGDDHTDNDVMTPCDAKQGKPKFFNGAQRGARTHDPEIKSLMLYRD